MKQKVVIAAIPTQLARIRDRFPECLYLDITDWSDGITNANSRAADGHIVVLVIPPSCPIDVGVIRHNMLLLSRQPYLVVTTVSDTEVSNEAIDGIQSFFDRHAPMAASAARSKQGAIPIKVPAVPLASDVLLHRSPSKAPDKEHAPTQMSAHLRAIVDLQKAWHAAELLKTALPITETKLWFEFQAYVCVEAERHRDAVLRLSKET
jgi:hypothetical protein